MEKPKRVFLRSEQMFPLVEKYYSSSQTKKQFCEAESIAPHHLSYWLSKYKGRKQSGSQAGGSKFVSLKVKRNLESSASLEIAYPNGINMRLNAELSWPLVEKLMNKLADVSTKH